MTVRARRRGYVTGASRLQPGYIGTRTTTHAIVVASSLPYSYRFPFYAADNIDTMFAVAWANWYGDQLNTGSVLTIRGAYFEAPNGTLTPVTFGTAPLSAPGSSLIGVAPAGSNIWGNCAVSGIAAGSKCYLRYCLQGSVSRYWNNGNATNVAMGESASPGTNLIGAMTDTGAEMTRPSAIVGYTRRKSYAVLGDSTQCDTNGTGNIPSPGYFGQICRGFKNEIIGHANFGLGNAALEDWNSHHSLRDELIVPYAYGILNGYGAVDILKGHGASAAQMKGYVQANRALYTGKKYYVKTIDQQTISNDNWQTLVGQTGPVWGPAADIQRTAYNADILTNPGDYGDGVIETTAFSESGGSGATAKWIVNGTFRYATDDGGHSSQQMFALYDFPGFGGLLS